MRLTQQDYAVHNVMEDFVDQAIAQVLSEDASACRCDFCRDDLKCLALNRLQAQYEPVLSTPQWRADLKLDRLESGLFNLIMIETYKSLTAIKANPRHEGQRTAMRNCTEDFVFLALRDILVQEKLSFERDGLSRVVASALNALKPQYTTTTKGDVFTRTMEVDPGALAKLYASIYNALKGVQTG